MAIVYIGIGSNLGKKAANCKKAVKLLSETQSFRLVETSKWYKTKAVVDKKSREEQPDYVNGVVEIETGQPPEKILMRLMEIEAEMGRVRTGKKWEPRVIDLDMLFYDDEIIDEPHLKVPHPELHKRMFVLEPLCDIAPDMVHPVKDKSIRQLMEELL